MKIRAWMTPAVCCLIPFFGIACEEITPLWKGVYELGNYTLYTNEPCQYTVDIEHAEERLQVKLELTITYYNRIARQSLPLVILLENQDSTHWVQEFNTEVILKEAGEWNGRPLDSERPFDLTLTHVAIPALSLKPGQYNLKIYADDLRLLGDSDEIEGVTRIDARFYEVRELQET